MKKTICSLLAGVWLVSSFAVQAADLNSIARASMILSTVAGLAEKYKDVQDMLDAGTLELEVPEPIEGSEGKFYFPYTQSGYLTPWAEKALNAQVGAEVGSRAADGALSSLASKAPLGGFLAGKAKSKAKETGAVMAIGGWDFIAETTELSFNRLDDLSVYMHSEFEGEADYEQALAAAMAIYPELERGHERAIDKAYKDARRKARQQ